MFLYNTLTKAKEEIKPLKKDVVNVYTCGPTLYDHVHIGNLRSFIFADTLNRALKINGYKVNHVINFTDVDDKTIKSSQEQYPDDSPEAALRELTQKYRQVFLSDIRAIGNNLNDPSTYRFVSAVDNISKIQDLINRLYQKKFVYIADDGVYFSIDKYKKSGKKYGQLTKIDAKNTSKSRISNDEYDKASIHDFALWKTAREGEPAWDFELDGHSLLGRPGWHIECSAMSTDQLGQPFDIHTGGNDLIFPHHENEIAQSTAGQKNPRLARIFAHNQHLLVDGRKMSKSLNNFYTLQDTKERCIDPTAFRLMMLQSHYRHQANFTWEALEAAQNRLNSWRALADLKWQARGSIKSSAQDQINWHQPQTFIKKQLADDLDTPLAITWLDRLSDELPVIPNNKSARNRFQALLDFFDKAFGLELSGRPDIDKDIKQIISDRGKARHAKNWSKADELRARLDNQGVEIKDTEFGPIWSRAS